MNSETAIQPGECPEPWIVQADARALPLAGSSAGLIVTSPPYFGMRRYTDGGRPCLGQVGAETTPAQYLDGLIECTREMIRVLKPAGSLWVNLGDSYSQRRATRQPSHQDGLFPGRRDLRKDWRRDKAAGLTRLPCQNVIDPAAGRAVPEKSLLGLPWRYALRVIDELGLILRAELIWAKPTGMPESVTDRVRRCHETWFHFTKNPRYYSALDLLREPHAASSLARAGRAYRAGDHFSPGAPHTLRPAQFAHPAGRLPGSVWTIPLQPQRIPAGAGVRHHAAFPAEWARRIILGWSPRQVCPACGQARQPSATAGQRPAAGSGSSPVAMRPPRRIAPPGRAGAGGTCACPGASAPAVPGVVLDPFGGTGTVALAACVHGRRGISADLSGDYCRLARWRVHDPAQRARATGPAPAPVVRYRRHAAGGSAPAGRGRPPA